MSGICNLVDTFNKVVVNPLILLIFALGTLVFVYGVVEFVWGLNRETELRENGRMHMIYGLLGMLIMISAWAIIKLIASSVGASLTCS